MLVPSFAPISSAVNSESLERINFRKLNPSSRGMKEQIVGASFLKNKYK
jgi:hypothetical protein